jgi:hypothetical protein
VSSSKIKKNNNNNNNKLSVTTIAETTPPFQNPNHHLYLHHFGQSYRCDVGLLSPHWGELLNIERAIIMAFSVKNKIGFVDNIISPLANSSTDFSQWSLCNNMVKYWLLNSRSTDIFTSVIYCNLTSDIWLDLKLKSDSPK